MKLHVYTCTCGQHIESPEADAQPVCPNCGQIMRPIEPATTAEKKPHAPR